jgi:hypothetical protein
MKDAFYLCAMKCWNVIGELCKSFSFRLPDSLHGMGGGCGGGGGQLYPKVWRRGMQCKMPPPHDFDNQCSAAIVFFSPTMPILRRVRSKMHKLASKSQNYPGPPGGRRHWWFVKKASVWSHKPPTGNRGGACGAGGCCLSYFEGMECNAKYKMIPMISITISFQPQ